MSNIFAAAERLVSAAVDSTMTEEIENLGVPAGEFYATAAIATTGPRFRAIVDIKPAIARLLSRSRDDGELTDAAAAQVHVSVDETLFAAASPAIIVGSRLKFVDRAPPITVRVSVIEEDGLGRVLLRCMRVA